MSQPLKGLKVVEVSMWAYVPSAGAVLSDWGASVTKIETPDGDPIRYLNYSGLNPAELGYSFMYDIFNRGKRSVAMDLKVDGARELLFKLIDEADVFLTSLLPAARRKLGIDVSDVQGRNADVIYAVGSGQGAKGLEAEKGGYDSISYWSRSGLASAITPQESSHPLAMPCGAFGDGQSGLVLAGGIAAAIAQRALTGEATVVDGALLASGMWAMQPNIVASTIRGVDEMPKSRRSAMPNPLVNTYRTADDRYIALCMLQGQRYWPGFCAAAGREDLAGHADFASDALRAQNIEACIAALDEEFAKRTLEEWKSILATQEGQWDVVQKVGELPRDAQAVANDYVQQVPFDSGRTLPMVSVPVQFGREASRSRPAPDLGEHTDEVMMEIGLDMDQILDAKIAGILL